MVAPFLSTPFQPYVYQSQQDAVIPFQILGGEAQILQKIMLKPQEEVIAKPGSVMDIIQLHCLVSGIGAHDIGRGNEDNKECRGNKWQIFAKTIIQKMRNKGNMCSWQFSLPRENWQRLLFPLTCGMDT
ncbi:hypothetical protein GOBAR_DD03548 [Gossypium barbadense]|nr:hypothetical protein GOBAR_DD03548 [Gossypium barbadense]